MRISEWSSDVCSSDLQRCAAMADAYVRTLAEARQVGLLHGAQVAVLHAHGDAVGGAFLDPVLDRVARDRAADRAGRGGDVLVALAAAGLVGNLVSGHRPDDTAQDRAGRVGDVLAAGHGLDRSEEHTSELQSLMRTS